MGLADERAEEHAALLRLAAGGFRDMTRIAAGHPGIWPDICAENRDAIVEVLDGLIGAPGRMRATSWPRATATACWPCSSGPGRPGPTCPVRVARPDDAGRGAGARARPPRACWPRSPRWPPSSASTSPTSRSPTRRGRRGVLILLVDGRAGRAVPGRPHGPRLPAVGRARGALDVTRPRRCRRAAGRPARRHRRGARLEEHHQPGAAWRAALAEGTSTSPAPWSPTTPRRWSTALRPLGVDVAVDGDAPTAVEVAGCAARPLGRRPRRRPRRPPVGHHRPLRAARCSRSARARTASTAPPRCGRRPMGPALDALRRPRAPTSTRRASAGHLPVVVAGAARSRGGAVRCPATCRASSCPACCWPAPAMRRRPRRAR